MKTFILLVLCTVCGAFAYATSPKDILAHHVWAEMEHASNIEAETLYSIALAESGKTVNGQFIPNPFAIAVGEDASIGQDKHLGFYPTTKEEAVDLLAELLADGHTNIGLGMMQVNIKANPNLVTDITSLFDPEINLSKALSVLEHCSKYEKIRAILSCYNRGSPTSPKGLAYADKVLEYQEKYASEIFIAPPVGELSYAQLLSLIENRTSPARRRRAAPIQILN